MGIQALPLVRFYNQEADDSVYTNDPAEINQLESDDNWCSLGPIGWGPPTQLTGTIPLYRYFNSRQSAHFYTTDGNEVSANPDFRPEGNYWVFKHDGDPDPAVYAGPPAAKVAIASVCSAATITVNGQSGRTTLSGTVDLTIDPDCESQSQSCGLTIAKIDLSAADFSAGSHAITQASLNNYRYEVGTWQRNNTYLMPNMSTTVTAKFTVDGTASAITLINTTSPLQGTLNADYTNFTMNGAFSNGRDTIQLNLCGHVVAHPPTAVLTPKGPFQCDSPQGAHVIFSSAQSSDPDNDITSRVWRVDNSTAAVDVVDLPTVLTLGSHPISVSVYDSRRAFSTASETVQVVDKTPPLFDAVVTPNCLWPVNHKFVLLTLGSGLVPTATDSCDTAPKVRIVDVASNQPALGGGSGNTTVDYKFGSRALCLRAERDGSVQSDRQYTVTLEATDGSGNKSTKQVIITVPHDQAGGNKCDSKSAVYVADDDPRCLQNAS
jgi:hypothetical protein